MADYTLYPSPSSISTAASTPQGFFSGKSEAFSPGIPLVQSVFNDLEEMPFFEWSRHRLGLSRRTTWRLSIISALSAGLLLGVASGALMAAPAAIQLPTKPAPAVSAAATTQMPVKDQKMTFDNIPGFSKQQVDDRTVWVYVPPTIYPKDRKAVLVLHGSLDSPEGIAEASNFHSIAARTSPGFIVVYPEMLKPGGLAWGYNAPWEHHFFRGVVDLLVDQFAVARDEIFVTGHSAGGSMTLYLQNNMPELFKGAAAVEAGVGTLSAWRNESYGRPTMVVWNHNDPVLAEFGGDQLFHDTVTQLRRHDDPKSWPDQILALPAGYQGVVSAERKLWKAREMQPRTHIISWTSADPTHHWVNGKNLPGAPLDASILIWDFFQAVDKDD